MDKDKNISSGKVCLVQSVCLTLNHFFHACHFSVTQHVSGFATNCLLFQIFCSYQESICLQDWTRGPMLFLMHFNSLSFYSCCKQIPYWLICFKLILCCFLQPALYSVTSLASVVIRGCIDYLVNTFTNCHSGDVD